MLSPSSRTAAATAMPLLVLLALAGLFYASFIAFAQTDMKRLVAYSSIGHMGLVVLGIAIWNRITLPGAVLQMVNHGLTTAALFIMVGMLDERIHSRRLADVGGLWQTMPRFSGFFLLFGLSAVGLPGLNNFVSEILILVGTFGSHPAAACFGFAAMVLTLAYILRLLQNLLFGPAMTSRGTCRSRSARDLRPAAPGPGCHIHRLASPAAARPATRTGQAAAASRPGSAHGHDRAETMSFLPHEHAEIGERYYKIYLSDSLLTSFCG